MTDTHPKPPSIRKLAQVAGVAPSTVSKILNSSAAQDVPVKEETFDHVWDVSQRLGYQPNVHAQRIFGNRSHVIALAIPDCQDIPLSWHTEPNLARSLGGISTAADQFKQDLLMVTTNEQFKLGTRPLELFRSKKIDGMLIWGAHLTDHYVRELHRQAWPIVLVTTHLHDPAMAHVIADNQAGSRLIVEHLYELGHRQVAYIAGPGHATVGQERSEAFEREARQRGMCVVIYQGDYSFECGQRLGTHILNESSHKASPCTAVACGNDLMALGVIQAAEQCGIGIPQSLSVAGADGVFPYYRPLLTTFEIPAQAMGRHAVEILLNQINAVHSEEKDTLDQKVCHITLDVSLIVGQTTGPVASEAMGSQIII